jgi:hypothetical protein
LLSASCFLTGANHASTSFSDIFDSNNSVLTSAEATSKINLLLLHSRQSNRRALVLCRLSRGAW